MRTPPQPQPFGYPGASGEGNTFSTCRQASRSRPSANAGARNCIPMGSPFSTAAGKGHGGKPRQVGGAGKDVRELLGKGIRIRAPTLEGRHGIHGHQDQVHPGESLLEIHPDGRSDLLRPKVVFLLEARTQHVRAKKDAQLDLVSKPFRAGGEASSLQGCRPGPRGVRSAHRRTAPGWRLPLPWQSHNRRKQHGRTWGRRLPGWCGQGPSGALGSGRSVFFTSACMGTSAHSRGTPMRSFPFFSAGGCQGREEWSMGSCPRITENAWLGKIHGLGNHADHFQGRGIGNQPEAATRLPRWASGRRRRRRKRAA